MSDNDGKKFELIIGSVVTILIALGKCWDECRKLDNKK